jgi:hypothetical protein
MVMCSLRIRITLRGTARLDWRKDYSKERTRMCSGAWQWLSDHPEVTNHLEAWFQRHVAELKEIRGIN